jgi:hypothetical protein
MAVRQFRQLVRHAPVQVKVRVMTDLVTLLASVTTLRKLVEEVSGIAGQIRGGVFGNAAKVKEELQTKVDDLDRTLKQVGQLVGVGRAYLATHENVLETLQLARRAERVQRESTDDMRGRDGPIKGRGLEARGGSFRLDR